MKLAEALILRADKKKRFEQLKERLLRNAKVQEGDVPAEDPQSLLEDFERTTQELGKLMQQINRTNAATRLEDGASLSDVLAVREMLALKQTVYRALAQAAVVTQDRYTKSEVKFKGTVNVANLQAQADALAKAHRELDTQIQAMNWRVDLLD